MRRLVDDGAGFFPNFHQTVYHSQWYLHLDRCYLILLRLCCWKLEGADVEMCDNMSAFQANALGGL